MYNHFHLLLKTGYVPLSTVMRRLLTGYAQQFNRRHRRHGPLVQNRFKSILCEEDPYFLELIRYIHLNPLRAGIVPDLNSLKKFPYSGHSAVMGKLSCEWQNVDEVLKMFSHKIGHARRLYAAFVAKGVALGRRTDLTGGGLVRSVGGWSALKALRSSATRIMGDERILGSGEFVELVLKRANENYEQRTHVKAKGLSLEAIINNVSQKLDIPPQLIRSTGKQRRISRARAIVCLLAVKNLGVTGRQVARELKMSPSAVSKAIIRASQDDLTKTIGMEILYFDQ
jgi:hypothetical protein